MRYLVLGKENFEKVQFVQDLRSRLFPKASNPEINFQEFVAKKEPLKNFLEFIQTTPFLSEKKLAVLKCVEGLTADEKNLLLTQLSHWPSFSVAVFISDESSAKKDSFLKTFYT